MDHSQRLCQQEEADKEESYATPARHSFWLLHGLLAVSFFGLFALARLLLSLPPNSNEPGHFDDTGQEVPFRRPDDDYTLDPAWDFGAPSQVRTYDWTIVERDGNPDGVSKPMTVINGQFPGPLVEINEGDIVVVNVRNQASNSTAIHWHGIFQNGSNWQDGAAGITQCPISPGNSYQYMFNVTGQTGTYFYHGHQGVQALEGLVGPIVVHSRTEADRQPTPYASDRVLLLQDWYYDSASGLMRDVLSPGVENAPIPNTALINGLNQAVCSNHPGRKCSELQGLSVPSLDLSQGQSHRLRVINVGAFAWFQVAVDKHELTVIEVDGTTVEPTLDKTVLIAPGQRYSAVIAADHPDKTSFWLRARMVTSCFAEPKLPEHGVDEAKAIVSYHADQKARHDDQGDEKEPILPQTNSEIEYIARCRDMGAAKSFAPSPPLPAPVSADHSWYLRSNLAIGDWRLQRGVLNSSSFRPNLTSPSIYRILDGLAEGDERFTAEGVNDEAFDSLSELTISHNAAETVDIVLQNMDENSHPFHLHGAQMWVLGAGHGYFPGYEALGLRPGGRGLLDARNASVVANPLRRDTATAEGFGWALLRFVADNPGVWLFHCHVLWHSEAGMAMQFVARPDLMRAWEVPDAARRLCDAPAEDLLRGSSPKDEVFYGFHHDGT
ncbi:multicopper oxidase [Xylariaceae sp. FL0804]|nr:multicopper oxidase [Xylariaceae sp. FL0804]